MRDSDVLMAKAPSLVSRTATVVAVVLAFGLGMLLLAQATVVFLLLFVAVLIAILFQGLADALGKWLPLAYWVRLCFVISLVLGAACLAAFLRAPAITEQVTALREELPRAIASIQEQMHQHEWGRHVLTLVPDASTVADRAVSRGATVATTTLAAFGYFLFIAFTVLFVAFEPRLYRRGIELLVPASQRQRASEVLDEIWQTLWWWLVARGAAMLFVGLTITIGLTILDVPLALTLGLIAALLDFVPNFGPIVAAVPAVLLAAVNGLDNALIVAALYFTVQMLEGNLVTPLAQKHAIDMPPAIVVVSQFALGAAFGTLGFVVATPLVATLLVLVRELYIDEASPAP